jgi:hypothetical protein
MISRSLLFHSPSASRHSSAFQGHFGNPSEMTFVTSAAFVLTNIRNHAAAGGSDTSEEFWRSASSTNNTDAHAAWSSVQGVSSMRRSTQAAKKLWNPSTATMRTTSMMCKSRFRVANQLKMQGKVPSPQSRFCAGSSERARWRLESAAQRRSAPLSTCCTFEVRVG